MKHYSSIGTEKIGQTKTKRNLRENETLDNAAHIEISIELNIRGYQNAYQKKFREQNPYYYGWKQYLRLHPELDLTYEQYIEIRKTKEEKKKQQEIEND